MRKLVAIFTTAAGIVVAVWLSAGAGDVTPNRILTCEAEATPALRAKAPDAGYRIARHFQMQTGAERTVLPDGGLRFILSKELRDDVRIKDVNECDVDPCSLRPVLCTQARSDSEFPFLPVQPRCVRRKADAGLTGCQRKLPDGGATPSDGDPCVDGCNVMRRADAVLDATCEAVACSAPSGASVLRELDPEAP